MIRILVLAAFLVVGSAVEDAEAPVQNTKQPIEDADAEPSSPRSSHNAYFVLDNNRVWDSQKGSGQDEEVDLNDAEYKIVQDVYSPDYYEPNIILDYRYMKSGGRGYARSDGGQILILPRRNNMPMLHNNYDTLIEHLRLKHLEEMERKWGRVLKRDHDRMGPDTYDDFGEGNGD